MKLWQSKAGWALAGLYLATAVWLILSQGLFGESFIAVFLGLPWSALLTLLNDRYRYFPPEGSPLYPVVLYAHVLFPIVLNASLLYLIGSGLERYLTRRVDRKDET